MPADDDHDSSNLTLALALNDYVDAAEAEARKGRQARDRALLAAHEDDGVPVAKLAEAIRVTPKALYKALDRVRR